MRLHSLHATVQKRGGKTRTSRVRMLNKRQELVASCKHVNKFLLKKLVSGENITPNCIPYQASNPGACTNLPYTACSTIFGARLSSILTHPLPSLILLHFLLYNTNYGENLFNEYQITPFTAWWLCDCNIDQLYVHMKLLVADNSKFKYCFCSLYILYLFCILCILHIPNIEPLVYSVYKICLSTGLIQKLTAFAMIYH